MKRTLSAFMALLCFTLVASAADVTGKWTAESPGRNGTPQVTTFDFKADGAKLEGSVTSTRGGNPMTTPITDGKVKGDSIEITREGGRGPQTMTAKKAQ
jgi:hypothetical protein